MYAMNNDKDMGNMRLLQQVQLRRHHYLAPKVLVLLEKLQARCVAQVVFDCWQHQCAERRHQRERRKLVAQLQDVRLRRFEAILAWRLGQEELVETRVFLAWQRYSFECKVNETLRKQALCHEAAMDSLLAAACAPAMDSLLSMAERTHGAYHALSASGEFSHLSEVKPHSNAGETPGAWNSRAALLQDIAHSSPAPLHRLIESSGTSYLALRCHLDDVQEQFVEARAQLRADSRSDSPNLDHSHHLSGMQKDLSELNAMHRQAHSSNVGGEISGIHRDYEEALAYSQEELVRAHATSNILRSELEETREEWKTIGDDHALKSELKANHQECGKGQRILPPRTPS
eukprot:gnl/MRDRNA2_/MRDRNA2_103060_c0_seq1.p1 gnl/MRDRNA2_/MRDRNA2_103060_c0~~gnl/MRDRNA2_/MRDRNA2_103060_c0_seq1.p1  ORF type:complete len:370 (+),score=76.90 gnl/MRDRNA2_/MRDRNA2_103060_c0_seq1:78-1112(+)